MQKQELLNLISQSSSQNLMTERELLTAFRAGQGMTVGTIDQRRVGTAEILYAIGGAIVFLGIVVLVYQNWGTLTGFTRILATLGSSVAAYVVGVLLSGYKRFKVVGEAFFLISALLAPLGIAIALDEAGRDIASFQMQTFISVVLLAVYLSSFLIYRSSVFIIFGIISGTWLFFSLTSWLVEGRPLFDETEFYEYRILATGLSYILLGYYFFKRALPSMTGWLYGLGILAFLGAALSLGGWTPEQNTFWEVIFPGLAIGTAFLSINLKSKALLVFGSLFLMAYILKITAEYFEDSLGWPLALVIAGLALIGIGYGTFYLNQRYLSTKRKLV